MTKITTKSCKVYIANNIKIIFSFINRYNMGDIINKMKKYLKVTPYIRDNIIKIISNE